MEKQTLDTCMVSRYNSSKSSASMANVCHISHSVPVIWHRADFWISALILRFFIKRSSECLERWNFQLSWQKICRFSLLLEWLFGKTTLGSFFLCFALVFCALFFCRTGFSRKFASDFRRICRHSVSLNFVLAERLLCSGPVCF